MVQKDSKIVIYIFLAKSTVNPMSITKDVKDCFKFSLRYKDNLLVIASNLINNTTIQFMYIYMYLSIYIHLSNMHIIRKC